MMKKTIILLLGLVACGHAQTVNWGSSYFQTQVQSDGSSGFTDAGFTFQIGTFAGVVDPTVNDANELAAAWRVLDESGYDTENVVFDSTATISASGFSDGLNATPGYDFRGEKLYIWAYDGNAPATDDVTVNCYEWMLFSGGSEWTLPNSATQQDQPRSLRTSPTDLTTAPIYGGLNDVQATDGGNYTDAGTFEIQTHEVCLTAVPEPSGALLILLGSTAVFLRRQRS